jgi:uncharacterized protein (DUF2062 family)
MKILILSNHNQKKLVNSISKRPDLTFEHHATDNLSSITELRYAADIAEKNGCEWTLHLQDNISLENVNAILDEVVTDQPPFELIVADSASRKLACQSKNHDHRDGKIEEASLLAPTGGNKQENKNLSDDNKIILMMQLLTGEKICGFRNTFRVYPTKLLINLTDKFYSEDYIYTNLLLKGSKAGYKIKNIVIEEYVPSDLLDPPPKNFFIKKLCKTLLPFGTKRLCSRNFHKEKFKEFIFHPLTFLKYLLTENATPGGLAAAAATGMFIGTLPLLGLHTATIIYVSIKLRLNKILSVNISHLCMPPFVPFACIEIGHFMLNGEWLDFRSFKTVVKAPHLRILEWILGSLVLAPINGIAFALITYIIASLLKKKKEPVAKI